MMSNGPCSARRSVHSGARWTSRPRPPRASAAPTRAGSPRAAGPSASGAAASAAGARRAGRSRGRGARGCAPGRPPRACRARSRPGTGRARLASSTSGRRASRCTFVASTTVRRGCARRRPAMKCSTANASVGGALVVLVVGDEAAAEVGRDHLGRREVLARERALARARRADQHDEAGIGEVDPHRLNTAICVGGPTSGVLRADRQVAHLVAVALARRRAPRPRTRARVHSKRWSGWRSCPAGSVSQRTLYSAFGRRHDDGARPRRAEDVLLGGGQARRVEVLDDLDERGRVEAGQALVAVRQRAVQQLDPLCAGRRASRRASAAARPARARARDTSTPTMSS